MHKVMRSLAVTGVAVAAGLSLAVSPAAAAPAPHKPVAPAAGHQSDRPMSRPVPVRKKVAFKGYHRTLRSCVKVGKLGEIRRQWDDSRCDRVQRGVKRGWYALNVSWDIRGHGPIRHHNHRPQR